MTFVSFPLFGVYQWRYSFKLPKSQKMDWIENYFFTFFCRWDICVLEIETIEFLHTEKYI